jgi:hypothetical protein
MTGSSATGRFWLCPECGKHVPGRRSSCVCGFDGSTLPESSKELWSPPRSEKGAPRSSSLITILSLAASVSVVAAIVLDRVQARSAAAAASVEVVPDEPEPTPQPGAERPVTEAPPEVLRPPELPPPSTPEPSAARPPERTAARDESSCEADLPELRPFNKESEAFRERVATLLEDGEFAELERLAKTLREQDSRFSSGVSRYVNFLIGLSALRQGQNDLDLRVREDVLKRWRSAFPDSHVPVLALSMVAHARAFEARGGGWAYQVDWRSRRGYERRLDDAWEWVEKAKALESRDPEVFAHIVNLCTASGRPWREVNDAINRSTAVNPLSTSVYYAAARYLLPRWHGSGKEMVAFAADASDSNPYLGDVIYVEVARQAWDTERREMRRAMRGLEWPRILRGLRELDRRYPDSVRTWHLMGVFAWLYEDHETAMAAFERLDDCFDKDAKAYWHTKRDLQEARVFALGWGN